MFLFVEQFSTINTICQVFCSSQVLHLNKITPNLVTTTYAKKPQLQSWSLLSGAILQPQNGFTHHPVEGAGPVLFAILSCALIFVTLQGTNISSPSKTVPQANFHPQHVLHPSSLIDFPLPHLPSSNHKVGPEPIVIYRVMLYPL